MIKVSVLYPAETTTHFDHDYYRDTHLPLLAERMGDACIRYSIDKGISGAGPGSAPIYVAMCHIYSDSLESFQAGFGPHAAEITGDVANYTDGTPAMMISEVVVE